MFSGFVMVYNLKVLWLKALFLALCHMPPMLLGPAAAAAMCM